VFDTLFSERTGQRNPVPIPPRFSAYGTLRWCYNLLPRYRNRLCTFWSGRIHRIRYEQSVFARSNSASKEIRALLCDDGRLGLLLAPHTLLEAVAQYHIDSWTTDSGLPHNAIRDILQTRDGYLWLATADGLVRFDGVRFTIFNRANSPGMTENRITALFRDHQGDLWMGSDGSIMRMHNGIFTGYGRESGVPNGMVGALRPTGPVIPCFCRVNVSCGGIRGASSPYQPDHSRTVQWLVVTQSPHSTGFGSQNAVALQVYARGRLLSWDTRQGSPAFRIRAVAEDEQGTIWAAATGKLFRDQGGGWRRCRFPPTAQVPKISASWLVRNLKWSAMLPTYR
jgi:Two component regulator propeller